MHKTLDYTMRTMMKLFFVFCLVLFQGKDAFSQKTVANSERSIMQRVTANGSDVLIWSEAVSEVKYDGSKKSFIMFEGAVYLDDSSLPVAIRNIQVSGENTIKANLEAIIFVPLANL